MASEQDKEKASFFKRLYHASVHRVLERMRMLGFWPTGVGLPEDPSDEAKERAAIEAEIAALQAQATVADPEKALREERIRRWQESKKRRAARKAELLEQQKKRAAAYAEYKAGTIVHAGIGVSGGLQDRQFKTEELLRRGLPVIGSNIELAKALGITIARLRWLTYHRRAAALVHYHRYGIPKKTGGIRSISAPKPDLAQAQQWIQAQILSKLSTEPEAHGFVRERSIVTNASPHVGKAVVINLDVRDFFPTVTFPRVKGLFKKLGYSGEVATALALLCTEPPRVAAELDGKVFNVAVGDRRLPQGACTSPSITNLLCRKLDRRLAGLAKRHGATYTRYADDLTFSLQDQAAIGKLLKSVRGLLKAEGFEAHEGKTRIMRKGRRQEVTGVAVNQKLSIPRVEWRQLRAIIHNVGKNGLDAENREGHPHFEAHLRGRIAYVHMVDPKRAAQLYAALDRALGKAQGVT